MKKKVKAVVESIYPPIGHWYVQYTVYKKFLGIWWYDYHYHPMSSGLHRIDNDIRKLRAKYGDSLLVEDERK